MAKKKPVTERVNLVAELEAAGARFDGKVWLLPKRAGYFTFGRYGAQPHGYTDSGDGYGEYPLTPGTRTSVIKIVRWWLQEQAR